MAHKATGSQLVEGFREFGRAVALLGTWAHEGHGVLRGRAYVTRRPAFGATMFARCFTPQRVIEATVPAGVALRTALRWFPYAYDDMVNKA